MESKRQDLIGIVGRSKVFDAAEILQAYAGDENCAVSIRPVFVVRPDNAAQVQTIVRWANRTKTPLVPVSSGPPHLRGDTVPAAAGAVMVDLSGMKRIIRIDRRNRMAVIEPGVTFAQLQSELSGKGMRLSAPLLPRANKSVVASLLEREPTMVPRYQWAMLDPLRCIEVVWGDGEIFTTGEAARPGSLEKEWDMNLAQVMPSGPVQTDFYKFVSAAQGTMGIVTWASVKCEVLPTLHRLFLVPSRRLDDLVKCAYRILRFRFGDELLLLNAAQLAAILGQDADRIRSLREQLPPWILLVGVAGRDRLPRERVEFQEKDLGDIARQYGLELMPAIPGCDGGEVLTALLDPSREHGCKPGHKAGCRDIFFLTTLNRTPEFVGKMFSLAEARGYPAGDIGIYIQPVHQGASCHCEFMFAFDPRDPAQVRSSRELFLTASESLLQDGAFFSRPYGPWAQMVFNRDAQTTAVLKKIKNIFDPKGVMNPGKLCF